jgi:hypothetical protein
LATTPDRYSASKNVTALGWWPVGYISSEQASRQQMEQKNLFEFVKGILGGAARSAPVVQRRAPGAPRYEPPPARKLDPDDQNPATIVRIGKSTDGRELIMTLGLGTFLVDRETPTICYYQHGQVAVVPTVELRHLYDSLIEKRNVGEFALQYVDLLNVSTFEYDARTKKKGMSGPKTTPNAVAPKPPPRRPVASPVQSTRWPDSENPATITRVGRSNNGGELIMTLGLGTFVLHREAPDLKYYDRGREWDIQAQDLKLLLDALMAKQDMKEFQYTYVDLLNVATFLQDRRRSRQR